MVESGRRSVRWHGARSTAWRIVLRPERRYQALRLKAHRCAAAGLDSGTPAELLASMPFDGAVDRANLVRQRMGSAGNRRRRLPRPARPSLRPACSGVAAAIGWPGAAKQ